MKKLLSLIFAAIILTGCWGNPPDLEDRVVEDPNQEYEYTGIIETLEIDVYQQGTHQIRTDDNELIIIQSQNFDLNRYLEERVDIKGVQAEVIGDGEPVLNVMEIEFEDGEQVGEFLNYENKLFGFSFDYPGIWELENLTGGISLIEDGYKWIKIEIFIDKTDMDAFVDTQESEEGTPVTIGAQRSLRYTDGVSTHVYIHNPPKKKVYRITFNEDGRDIDGEKQLFYELLESFKLIYRAVRTGEKCGGEENIKCPEEYRCELDSAESDASGICVLVDSNESELDCPYISPPTDCVDYRIFEYSKTTGCPTRYECTSSDTSLRDEEDEKGDEEDEGLDISALTSTIEKYQDQILNINDAVIIQYEITKDESLIAIIYEDDDKKYKTLYSFAPSANEYNFIEKAHLEEGEDRDWELISGTNIQNDYGKTVIKAMSSDGDNSPREVSSDMRLYENPHKDFTLEYPKNWYYMSFGAINDTVWTVGFADKSMDYFSDAIISISIVDEKPDSSDFGYFTVRDRDDETIYVIEGPEDLKETVDKMADSIE